MYPTFLQTQLGVHAAAGRGHRDHLQRRRDPRRARRSATTPTASGRRRVDDHGAAPRRSSRFRSGPTRRPLRSSCLARSRCSSWCRARGASCRRTSTSSSPDSVRGFLPGFAYQCGVLFGSVVDLHRSGLRPPLQLRQRDGADGGARSSRWRPWSSAWDARSTASSSAPMPRCEAPAGHHAGAELEQPRAGSAHFRRKMAASAAGCGRFFPWLGNFPGSLRGLVPVRVAGIILCDGPEEFECRTRRFWSSTMSS